MGRVGAETIGVVHVSTCPVCGAAQAVTIDPDAYIRWKQGAKIQEAFPALTPDERESLQTGICQTCWDAMTPEEDR